MFPRRQGIPGDELPAVLPTPQIVWRDDGTVIAVPSIALYSTGCEIQIVGALRDDRNMAAEEVSRRLDMLRMNGSPVQMLSGERIDHGFRYRAWVPFAPGESDCVFTLGEGPAICVDRDRVAEAADKVTRLVWT